MSTFPLPLPPVAPARPGFDTPPLSPRRPGIVEDVDFDFHRYLEIRSAIEFSHRHRRDAFPLAPRRGHPESRLREDDGLLRGRAYVQIDVREVDDSLAQQPVAISSCHFEILGSGSDIGVVLSSMWASFKAYRPSPNPDPVIFVGQISQTPRFFDPTIIIDKDDNIQLTVGVQGHATLDLDDWVLVRAVFRGKQLVEA